MSDATSRNLDDLLPELIEEFHSIENVAESDVMAIANRYPDHADEIRSTLGMLLALDELDDNAFRPDQPRPEPMLHTIGDFQLVREIGRGGMGIVYEARQLTVERTVAVKLLPFATLADETRLRRFKNEIRAIGTLQHPNIVQIHSVGQERGIHYFAMQYVDGPSLAEVLRSLRRNTEPVEVQVTPIAAADSQELKNDNDTLHELQAGITTQRSRSPHKYLRSVVVWISQVADALSHAHENGVLHRDVKPGNILLGEDGKAWVADFGLARIEQDASITATDDLLGTVRYMAPEQASGSRGLIDHRADIYSLGATLYELLTLTPLCPGENREDLVQQILHETPVRPSRLIPDFPSDLEVIVLKAVSKEASERYLSADEFAEDLRRFLRNKPILAKTPSAFTRGYKWCLRHPRLTSLLVLVCLVTIVLTTVLYTWSARRLDSIRSHLNTARTLSKQERHEEAHQEAFLAVSKLGPEWWIPASMSQKTRKVESQLRQLRDSYSRFERLKEAHSSIAATLHITSPSQLNAVREECRQALAIFPSLNDLDDSSLVALNTDEKLLTKQLLMELRFIWTLCIADAHHETDEDRDAAYLEATKSFDTIVSMHRDFPAAGLWQAEFWRGLGDETSASQREAEASRLTSESSLEWYLLGEFHFYKCDFSEAKRCFEKATTLEPRNVLIVMSLARCHWELANRAVGGWYGTEGQLHLRVASALCTGALVANPRITSAYITRLQARRRDGDARLVEMDLDSADEATPGHYLVTKIRAECAAIVGDRAECLRLIKKAQEQADEPIPETYLRHAFYLLCMLPESEEVSRASREKAIDLASYALELLPKRERRGFLLKYSQNVVPRRVRAHLLRGVAQLGTGNTSQAEDDLNAVIKFESASESVKVLKAVSYLLLSQVEEAVAVIEELETSEVDRGCVLETLELLRCSSGLNSVEYLDIVTSLLPRELIVFDGIENIAIAFNNKGRDMMREGKRIEAIPFFEKAADLAPHAHMPRFELGKCYFQLGDFESSLSWLGRAIDLEPKAWISHAQRALVHTELGDFESAITDLDTFLSAKSSTIWGLRAVLQLKLGRLQDYQAAVRKMPMRPKNCPTWWFTIGPLDDRERMQNILQMALDRVNEKAEVEPRVSSNVLRLRKELGSAHYRVGNLEDAREELTASLEQPTEQVSMSDAQRGLAACFLAMTEHQLERTDEADKWLSIAKRIHADISAADPLSLGGTRPDLQLAILVREATSLLEGDGDRQLGN